MDAYSRFGGCGRSAVGGPDAGPRSSALLLAAWRDVLSVQVVGDCDVDIGEFIAAQVVNGLADHVVGVDRTDLIDE